MIDCIENIDNITEKEFGNLISILSKIREANFRINKTIVISNRIFIEYKQNRHGKLKVDISSIDKIVLLVNTHLNDSEQIFIKTSLYENNIGIISKIKCNKTKEDITKAIIKIYETWFDDRAHAHRVTHFLNEENTFPAIFIQNFYEKIKNVVTRCPESGYITDTGNCRNTQNTIRSIDEYTSNFISKLENIITYPLKIYFRKDNEFIICFVKKEELTLSALFNFNYECYSNGKFSDLEFVLKLKPDLITEFSSSQIIVKNGHKVKGLATGTGFGRGVLVFTNSKIPENCDYIFGCEKFNYEYSDLAENSKGVFTARGGKTSHLALFGRGKNIPTVVGASPIDFKKKQIVIEGIAYPEFCNVFINGTKGEIYFSNEKIDFIYATDFTYKPNLPIRKLEIVANIINKFTANLDDFKELSIEQQMHFSLIKQQLIKLELL